MHEQSRARLYRVTVAGFSVAGIAWFLTALLGEGSPVLPFTLAFSSFGIAAAFVPLANACRGSGRPDERRPGEL